MHGMIRNERHQDILIIIILFVLNATKTHIINSLNAPTFFMFDEDLIKSVSEDVIN